MAVKKRKKKQSSGTGFLLFTILLTILLVLFIIKFPQIKATFEKTGLLEKLSTTVTTAAPAPAEKPQNPSATTVAPKAGAPASPGATPFPPRPINQPSASSTTTAVQPVSESGLPAGTAPAPAAGKSGANTAAEATRVVSLYFVSIADDGVISSHEVKRAIKATDTPLADTVKALLDGPSENEIRSKLISLIPRGTRLKGISMRGSTAILDFNEAFMYNHYGTEGYTAQLKQIVYTVTAFPAVQDVQILIEGKLVDYLGGEGVFTGKPLSRNSF